MDDEISQFVGITGADSTQARTFLEKAKGELQNALADYYQAQEDAENPQPAAAAAPATESSQPAPAEYTGPRTLSGAPAEVPSGWGSGANSGGNNSGTSTPNSTSRSNNSNQIRSTGSRGGISSFREIRERDSGSRGGGSGGPKIGRIQHNQEDEDDEDEGDEDESKGPANFYTGGERSGLSVQNPDRGRGRDEEDQPEMVRQILQQAEALGKQLAEGGGAGSSSSGRGGGTVGSTNLGFSGRGRTIGDESSTEQTPSTSTSNQPTSNDRMDQDQDEDEDDELDQISSEPVIRRITFWADGFSIGDGPLITSSDPRHEEILKAINAKRAPLALLNVAFGQEVELRIEKRINEKYKPPPPEPMKAFGGSGNRLGSPAPTFTPTTTTTTTNVGESKPAPASEVKLDESQPITQIQLRLGDGSRLVGRFNHTHTVADIRGFINTSNPDSAGRPYTLQSSFPPKPLTDESITIKDAGLLNSVVIQKWA